MVAAEQVLKGEYVPEQLMNAAMQELLEAVAETRKGVQEITIFTNITFRQWADFWGKSKEVTLSSRSSWHFGHYIMGALSNIISHFYAVKTLILL
jgi:hypothetical protein